MTDWERAFSSANLEGIPPQIRSLTPDYRATDEDIIKRIKQGVLLSGTPYWVVYRVAFAPRLQPTEDFLTDLSFRFGFDGNLRVREADDFPDEMPLWLLATTWGLHWHYSTDGAPGYGFEPHPSSFPGLRDLAYGDMQNMELKNSEPRQDVPFVAATFTHQKGEDTFLLVADQDNRALLREVYRRARQAHV